jgi:hypothetical protein
MEAKMQRLGFIAAIVSAASLGAGCDEDTRGSGDAGADSDADADAGDDAAADADTDSDSDADTDSDTDTDAVCDAADYPPGPYAWLLDGVVDDVTFPAIFDGAVTELVLSEAHCSEVKSLVFALGANT